jgi:hypothetical protein
MLGLKLNFHKNEVYFIDGANKRIQKIRGEFHLQSWISPNEMLRHSRRQGTIDNSDLDPCEEKLEMKLNYWYGKNLFI